MSHSLNLDTPVNCISKVHRWRKRGNREGKVWECTLRHLPNILCENSTPRVNMSVRLCPVFSDGLASLALIIMTDVLTYRDWILISHSSCLTVPSDSPTDRQNYAKYKVIQSAKLRKVQHSAICQTRRLGACWAPTSMRKIMQYCIVLHAIHTVLHFA